ncbi:hypothetical protein MCOR01_011585 [Pyricularia oryzae]|nr:hypothetical protein MCOR01_011585 [Pyricularia oryzae]
MLHEVIKEIGLSPETIRAAIQDEIYWKLKAEAISGDYEHSVENYTSIGSNIEEAPVDVSQRTKPNTPVVTKFGHEDFVNQLSRGLELHLTTVSWRAAKYGQQIAEETLPGYTPPDVKEKRMTFVEDEIARFEADTLCDENDDSGREDATPCDLHDRPPTSVSIYVWKEPSKSASLGCIANGAESTGSERQREVTEDLRSLDRPTTATRGPRRLRSTGDRNVRQQTSTTVTLSKLRSNARVVKRR